MAPACTTFLAGTASSAPAARGRGVSEPADRPGDVAVLTFNLVSHGRAPNTQATVARWSVTAVYVRAGVQWKIVHHHFSFTQPELKVQLPPL